MEWHPGFLRGADGVGEPGKATDLQLDPFRCNFFVAYSRNRTAGWVAQVRNVKLVSAKECADEIGRPLAEVEAANYFRFQLDKIQATVPRDVSKLISHRPNRPR